MLDVFDLLLAVICGFAVGGLAGALGVGGSFLLVPILNVVLQVPVAIAVGSTSCQMLGPATTALLARRLEREQLRLPLIISGGIITGVLVGASLLKEAGTMAAVTINDRSIPVADLLVMCLYFVMLVGIGSFSLFEVHRQRIGKPLSRGGLAALQMWPQAEFEELGPERLSIPVLAMFGLGTGIIAGILGISGAIVLIPGLVYLLGIRARQAILASLVVVWITSLYATLFHAWNGNVNLSLAVALMSGGTIGARLGSQLSVRLNGPALRGGIGWLALGTSALVLVRLVQLLA